MKNVLIVLLLFQFSNIKSQTYFWPVENGLVNAKTEEQEYTITLEGNSSAQIYNAIINKISRKFAEPEKVILSKKEFSYIKLFGIEQNAIGSGENSYNLVYNLEFKISNEKYDLFFSGIKINRNINNGNKITLHINSYNNYQKKINYYDKFLLDKKGKPSKKFKDEFYDLIRLTSRISKTFDLNDETHIIESKVIGKAIHN